LRYQQAIPADLPGLTLCLAERVARRQSDLLPEIRVGLGPTGVALLARLIAPADPAPTRSHAEVRLDL
jgi:hypothetical protein